MLNLSKLVKTYLNLINIKALKEFICSIIKSKGFGSWTNLIEIHLINLVNQTHFKKMECPKFTLDITINDRLLSAVVSTFIFNSLSVKVKNIWERPKSGCLYLSDP